MKQIIRFGKLAQCISILFFASFASSAMAQSTAPTADENASFEQTSAGLQSFYRLMANLNAFEGSPQPPTGQLLLADHNPEICSTFYRYPEGRAAKRLNRQLSLNESRACRIAYQGYEGSAFARLCLGSEAGSLAGAKSRFADFKNACHCFNPCGPNG